MTTTNKIIWIAWERHRRTLELCSYIGIDPIILTNSLPRILKHPILTFKTIFIIFKEHPSTLIVQSPSVFLAMIAAMFKCLFHYKLIVDTHNAGIVPDNYVLKSLKPVYKFLQKMADVTVVTNSALATIVDQNKGFALILPDRVPRCFDTQSPRATSSFNVVYICTFSDDEPYKELFSAVTLLEDPDITVKVTGKYKNEFAINEAGSARISFTGYLPEADYWKLLRGANLIVDLTTRDDCLLCGAYEAVAVTVPILLTDTSALRNYFYKGALFTDNCARDIADNIQRAKRHIRKLKQEITELNEEMEVAWEDAGRKFLAHL